MKLEKKVSEKYTTSKGEEVVIWAVPQQIIRSITPDKKKPQRPQIEMQLPKGVVQKRFINKNDENWELYQEELDTWEQEKNDLQEAVTYCFALKTYPYPNPLAFSDELEELSRMGLLSIPSNPYLKKFMWLRENVIAQHDEYNIRWIIQKLSGVPEEVVEEQKASFRNMLLGKDSARMGTNNPESEQTSEEVKE